MSKKPKTLDKLAKGFNLASTNHKIPKEPTKAVLNEKICNMNC